MPVLIVNPNCHADENSKRKDSYDFSTLHFKYVLKKYILDSGFKRVNFIAVGEGGKLIFDQLYDYQDKMFKIIGKMAFVDSFILSSRKLSIE
jgi:hypothetical protein